MTDFFASPNLPGLFTLGVLAVMFVVFVLEVYPVEVTAMLGAAVLVLVGIVPADGVLEVFSNPAPWTIAAMFIVSGGLGPTDDDLTRPALADAMGVELISDDASLRRIEAFFRLRGRIQRENTFHHCTICTRAHHAAVGFAAQQQFQRVDHDRFACPGFAGNDVEARREGQIQFVDNRKIADAQFFQHKNTFLDSNGE